MRILLACEVSGECRRAFRAKGHDAWSCDLLPPDDGSEFHIQWDAHKAISKGWDMMIAFPPCTYLCSSGLHWNHKRPERVIKTVDAMAFFMALVHAPIEKIAIENPIGCMSTAYRKPDQIIQPYMFGHAESKSTCLWLKNLPLLTPSQIVPKPACGYWDNQTPSGQNKLGPGVNRAKIRSTTYSGIAACMASTWG